MEKTELKDSDRFEQLLIAGYMLGGCSRLDLEALQTLAEQAEKIDVGALEEIVTDPVGDLLPRYKMFLRILVGLRLALQGRNVTVTIEPE